VRLQPVPWTTFASRPRTCALLESVSANLGGHDEASGAASCNSAGAKDNAFIWRGVGILQRLRRLIEAASTLLVIARAEERGHRLDIAGRWATVLQAPQVERILDGEHQRTTYRDVHSCGVDCVARKAGIEADSGLGWGLLLYG
jgi:hypothetical protein